MVLCLSNLLPLPRGSPSSLALPSVCVWLCEWRQQCWSQIRAPPVLPHHHYQASPSIQLCLPPCQNISSISGSLHFKPFSQPLSVFLLMLNPVLCFPAVPSVLSPCHCPQPFVSSLQPCYPSSGPPLFPASSPSPSYSAVRPSFPRPAFHCPSL